MGETGGIGTHNADNILRPIETGMVEKFDRLFAAREKTLARKVADLIANKQEFLARVFPNIITIGAEHPQLSGGALYLMGIITKHVPKGSEAINSIPRRFAERQQTKKAKELRPVLHALHKEANTPENTLPAEGSIVARIRQATKDKKTIPEQQRREQMSIVMTELTRAKITRELYDLKQCPINVVYNKEGKTIDLGRNSSEISILNKDSKTGRSMVFICSSAGNPPGVESFAVEYALRTGDKVYVIGQPDGASGYMSNAFADAAVRDANPPYFDLKRQFQSPTYEPHTQFMKQVISTVVPHNEQFDLYSHSGGGIFAKNLLHDPDISQRVKNAVFLNPAGVHTSFTLFPQAFRRLILFQSASSFIRDLPQIFRSTFELDRNEPKHTPAFWFRDRVTVAIQSGTHYRQPDWDSMKVNGGKIVLYVGGRDRMVGGKQFAQFLHRRLQDISHPTPSPYVLEYDKRAHHVTPFARPEEVMNQIVKQHFPSYLQTI